ncbi:hypothetical protein V2J09_001564 [Rumex salicifolius]
MTQEQKLESFLQWIQLNNVELRGSTIKYCDSSKGFGLFSTNDVPDGIFLVVPLDLAITPMRVLEDPLVGPECRKMFEDGEVDDRYIDMIPSTFGNPLWFTDDEFQELKGTSLYRATELQRKSLLSVFNDKVKHVVKRLLVLDGDSERANSVFWTRALNIPLPRAYIFPENQHDTSYGETVSSESIQGETVWIEGLVPGIDFCNHDLKAAATWEVDGAGGSITGIPNSMYLLSVNQNQESSLGIGKEISISYGDKGNEIYVFVLKEELLYLYGFVINENPDDYLMVNYPVEALQNDPLAESKMQLLQVQKAELRCLLPKRLLDHGFFPAKTSNSNENDKLTVDNTYKHSWSGQRKTPSYVKKLVFPEDFLTSLRTIALQEDDLFKVSSLLEELVGSEGEREPSDADVRAAIWEACGDTGALQLLVDLLNKKLMDLEEASGTEDDDAQLLDKFCSTDNSADSNSSRLNSGEAMSKNKWASIIYRRGQKQLSRRFMREAEHALQLSMTEET